MLFNLLTTILFSADVLICPVMLIYFGFFANQVHMFFKIASVIGYLLFILFPMVLVGGMAFDAPGSEKYLAPYIVKYVCLLIAAIAAIPVYKILNKPC